MSDLRPLPGDTSAAHVEAMFDLRSDEWWATAEGEYQTAAGEGVKADGTNTQRLVMLEWPARRNNSDETKVIRLLIAPEDALGLAEVLAHTAAWMLTLPPLED